MSNLGTEKSQKSDGESPSTSISPSNSTATAFSDDFFVRHRVSKFDTLAGLAVKYNVSVSDIKRANGFLSDTAMFARDIILIPTRPLAVGSEYSAWTGIFANCHRLPSGSRSLQSQPHIGSNAAVQRLRGYYSTGPSPLSASPEASDDEGNNEALRALTSGASRRSRPTPSEVELIDRGPSTRSTYTEDQLRRRGRVGEEGDDGEGGGVREPGATQMPFDAHRRMASLGDFKDLQRRSMRWKDNLMDKLKRVASQPALAGAATAPSMSQAADAAVLSTRGASGPVGVSTRHQMQQVMYNATSSRPKDSCPKTE